MTGNDKTGIRDYALDNSPLNYSDVGFDLTGPEVHADGEIWNAVNYDLRQALVKKYDAKFPSGDAALQLRCADGVTGGNAPAAPLPAEQCPGNRRWIQIMFDAFLLQQGDTSMLTARDAYLAADRMRFGGANQAELWAAFAKRGMGASAATDTTEDNQPTPGFDSPLANNATVTFASNAPERDVLRRPVRGPRDAGRDHGEVRARHLRRARARAGLRPASLQADRRAPARP